MPGDRLWCEAFRRTPKDDDDDDDGGGRLKK